MNILITGISGFIGYHLAKKLYKEDYNIIGLDNFNNYYDVNLKNDRAKNLSNDIIIHHKDICDNIKNVFQDNKPDVVIHLAAQAGVRYSLINPFEYQRSNIQGFLNILECCREFNCKLIYASSSSVYGNNKNIPFKETDNVDNPISLYATTKRCNELMAYTYSHLYNIQTIGLRFFTVYGPWYRPDMGIFKFTKNIIERKSIKIFNNGNLMRDFTYIDDIVDGIYKILINLDKLQKYDIYNIGNNKPENILNVVKIISNILNIKPQIEMCDMQLGDVFCTYANIDKIQKDVGYIPKTPINKGISNFIKWYREYYEDLNS